MSRVRKVAFVNDLPAEFARRRADVQDVIGGAHHLSVMLDDQHGVADVAQVMQQANQALAVARVQADGGLVQHIERADER